MIRILLALARGGGVLVAVALLLLLVPAQKAASSSVEVVVEGSVAHEGAPPLESARNLREAILDRETLQRLARELVREGSSEEEVIDAAARVDRGVDVVTTDGKTFHVVVSDTDAGRAERISNDLAALAVARAARVSPSCREPCRARGRVIQAASLVPEAASPQRRVALWIGVLIAFVAALLPLATPTSTATQRRLGEEDEDDAAPHTARLPPVAPVHPSRTLPLSGSSAPPGPNVGSAPPGARRQGSERPPSERPVVPQHPPAPPSTPPAETPVVSPILGYPAAPGWHPHPTLSPHNRTLLSSELSQQSAEDCVTIAVSGTRTPSDRRAAVAVELALVLANAGDRRVLLVEADFRNPGIAPLLELQVPEAVDFASELGRRAAGSGGASLGVLLCTDTLHVLPSAGSRPGDPVLTTHFDACLRLTRDFYDVVIIHAPPTAAGVFLTAVADVVDGVIVVGEDASRLPAGFSKKAFVRAVSA